MTRQMQRTFWGFWVVIAILGMSSLVFAQMKTPSPLDKSDSTDEEGYEDEEEDAGGIHYEEKVVTELDRSTIQSVIKKRNTSILYCYEKELQTNQDLRGRVVINFTIQLDGKVKGVKVVSDKTTLKDKKVSDCVLDIMKSLAFPSRKAGEPIEINYPFKFEPKAK